MNAPPVGVERRIGQRFALNLPVAVRDLATELQGLGFSQDLSSRGVFLFTEMALSEGAEVELTLKMPAEITLGENMPVRARGRVLRIVQTADPGKKDVAPEANRTKIGVAVCFHGYEYLSETEDAPADFRRIAGLHRTADATRSATPLPSTPRPAAN